MRRTPKEYHQKFVDDQAKKYVHEWRVMDIAYIRDGKVTHTTEAVILACLVHSRGKGRAGNDMKDVQRIMRDQNLDTTKKKEV